MELIRVKKGSARVTDETEPRLVARKDGGNMRVSLARQSSRLIREVAAFSAEVLCPFICKRTLVSSELPEIFQEERERR
jgi:hypothetical protein